MKITDMKCCRCQTIMIEQVPISNFESEEIITPFRDSALLFPLAILVTEVLIIKCPSCNLEVRIPETKRYVKEARND